MIFTSTSICRLAILIPFDPGSAFLCSDRVNSDTDYLFAATAKLCYIKQAINCIMEKIGSLKKVTLSIEAGTTPESMDLTPQPSLFEFIYGLGSKGLTPFEFQLADKTVDEEVRLQINGEQIPQVFQHLILPSIKIPEDVDVLYLRFRVMEIIPADQREVIKALAEIADCGDDCCGH